MTITTPRPRGDVRVGVTRKAKTGCGNLYITINKDDDGRPFEVFTQMGKAGGCAASQCEAIGRMVSMALRSGLDPNEIAGQLTGISCHLPAGVDEKKILSCSDAIGQALDWFLKNGAGDSK